jgi:ATP-binding cassette subfamily B (MDR/TAP) protein 1
MIDFTRATAAAAQLFALIDRKSKINPFNTSGKRPAESIGNLELHNVTFAYPTRPEVAVLDNFSLKAPAGKVTALVVSTGLVQMAMC